MSDARASASRQGEKQPTRRPQPPGLASPTSHHPSLSLSPPRPLLLFSVLANYEQRQSSLEAALHKEGSGPPSTELYQQRDYWLLQLSDAQLKAEYVRQTEAYLDPSTPPALRGMAEMLLIKLGGLVSKPQLLRVQQAEMLAASLGTPLPAGNTPL